MNKFKEFEEIIGYKFNNQTLLKTALTHSSYANENRGKHLAFNERLEFLGDSVLSLIVSNYLFENYTKMPEGGLTKARATIVCERSLWECALNIELGKFLILGKGEEMTGGRTRMSILADAYEALIAAIYLDGGISVVREWLLGQLYDTILLAAKGKTFTDHKTALQERLQAGGAAHIHYEVVGETGPDHKKTFQVHVHADGKLLGIGEGNSKKNAEQEAARDALFKMGEASGKKA
ncbi:MAG: ribonuclease III [Ruminococcaceae bacterium]|nr:ribonuclease III [Oscillospiraceae bacterium]